MKKIICFIILMTAALHIEASDFSGSNTSTKVAITFNFKSLVIDGKSPDQYTVYMYTKEQNNKKFKALYPSFNEYIAHWNYTVVPQAKKIFIDSFVSEETKLKKDNAISIVDEKDCQYLICVILKNIDSDGEIDAVAELKKKAETENDKVVASFDLNANGEHGRGLENKIPAPISKISKELCKDVLNFLGK